jgi:putative ABC transport system substrate-binding protein
VKIVQSKFLFYLLITILLTAALVAEAQQTKLPRVGLLVGGSASSDAIRIEAFRQGLRELGYVEGKNIDVEPRYAAANANRLPALATELVHLPVDVIVTAGTTATGAARRVTNTIAIVMAQDIDPVGAGFVATLARPGGNITGLSRLAPEVSGKQLELLQEIIPGLAHVAVLGTSTQPGTTQELKEIELTAKAIAVQSQYLDISAQKDIKPAFRSATKGHAGALLVLSGPILLVERKDIIELAAKSRLPAMYFAREFVEDGGLMTYAANVTEMWRRAATYVDKILKGAKPADLPVEQPTKFEFVINLKAAKQIGLTIPPNVLARADRVIR